MAKCKIILAEFAVTVYVDGTIDWDRFDRFLWRRIHRSVSRPHSIRPHLSESQKSQ